MTVTEINPDDAGALAELYQRQDLMRPLGLAMPDLGGAADLGGYAVRDGERIVMAVTARRAAEAVLLVDSAWASARWRLEALRELHGLEEARLRAAAVETVFGFLPPGIQRAYGRRLEGQFGWTRPPWACLTRRLGEAIWA